MDLTSELYDSEIAEQSLIVVIEVVMEDDTSEDKYESVSD